MECWMNSQLRNLLRRWGRPERVSSKNLLPFLVSVSGIQSFPLLSSLHHASCRVKSFLPLYLSFPCSYSAPSSYRMPLSFWLQTFPHQFFLTVVSVRALLSDTRQTGFILSASVAPVAASSLSPSLPVPWFCRLATSAWGCAVSCSPPSKLTALEEGLTALTQGSSSHLRQTPSTLQVHSEELWVLIPGLASHPACSCSYSDSWAQLATIPISGSLRLTCSWGLSSPRQEFTLSCHSLLLYSKLLSTQISVSLDSERPTSHTVSALAEPQTSACLALP